MEHGFLGVVEETRADVTGLKASDPAVAPFTYSDNTCEYCAKGIHISCRNGGQGETVRVPYADGTLVKLPVAADSTALPYLLALSDVMTTGHHGTVTAEAVLC